MINKLKQVYWGSYNADIFERAQEMLAQKYDFTPAPPNQYYIHYNQSNRAIVTFHSRWTLELISRFYKDPIKIISSYIKGPAEAISDRYLPICTKLLNTTENNPHFFIIGTAPSVFKSKQVQQWRELNGGYSTVQDSVICKRSQNFILGMSKIRKTIIIFINNTFDFDTTHQVLTFILASKLLPPEQTPPELSTQNFIKRLTRLCAELTETSSSFDDSRTGDTFKAFFDEYWENEDAFKIDITKQISTFLQERNKKELEQLERDYEQYQQRIRTAINTIAEQSTNLEKVSEQIEIIKQKISTGASSEIKEFMEFLERSKTIKNYSFSDGLLLFTVDSFLYVNDPEQFMTISRNILKGRLNSEEETNAYLKAFKHIFIDEEYKIRTMALVKLDMRNLVPARFNGVIPYNRIPSPHIMHYNCWGAHSNFIAERVKNKDLIGVVEQIIEACSGLNVYDSPVVSKFFSSLLDRDSYTCFIDIKNKQDISLREIMEVTNETDACVETSVND